MGRAARLAARPTRIVHLVPWGYVVPKLVHRVTGQSVHCSRRSVERLLAEGYVLPGAPEADAPAVVETDAPAVEDGPVVEAPARAASKDAWVAYAASVGVDDAESLTKAELIELVGDSDG